jgi:hypothetical protein
MHSISLLGLSVGIPRLRVSEFSVQPQTLGLAGLPSVQPRPEALALAGLYRGPGPLGSVLQYEHETPVTQYRFEAGPHTCKRQFTAAALRCAV